MLLYLDCCFLCRPFDDLRQPRNRTESAILAATLDLVRAGEFALATSETLESELRYIPDLRKQSSVLDLLALATVRLRLDQQALALAVSLEEWGIRGFDSLHLACAARGGVDYLLTVDDRLYKRARRAPLLGKLAVELPGNWLRSIEE